MQLKSMLELKERVSSGRIRIVNDKGMILTSSILNEVVPIKFPNSCFCVFGIQYAWGFFGVHLATRWHVRTVASLVGLGVIRRSAEVVLCLTSKISGTDSTQAALAGHASIFIDFGGQSLYESDKDTIPKLGVGVQFHLSLAMVPGSKPPKLSLFAEHLEEAYFGHLPGVLEYRYWHFADFEESRVQTFYLGTIDNIGNHADPQLWDIHFRRKVSDEFWTTFLVTARSSSEEGGDPKKQKNEEEVRELFSKEPLQDLVHFEFDFGAPERRWDANVNCHTCTRFLVQELGLQYPPEVSDSTNWPLWLVNTVIEARWLDLSKSSK